MLPKRLAVSLFRRSTIILIFVLTACQQSEDQTTLLPENPLAQQFDPDAINIGSVGWRTSTRDAVLLAGKQINQAGGVLGKRFNPIAAVARNNNEAQVFGQQIIASGVQVMTSSTSTRSLNLLADARDNSVVVISESSSSPQLTTADDNDLLFRLGVSDVDAVPVLADVATNDSRLRAVIIQNQDDAFGDGLRGLFAPAFQQRGGSVVATVEIPFGIKSGFETYIEMALLEQPDLILNAILNAEVSASLVSEAVSLGFDGLMLLPGTAAGNQTFIDNLVDPDAVIGGAKGSAAIFGDYNAASYQLFRQAYIDQYKIEPQGFTAATYDIVMVTALAIEHAGRANNTEQPSGTMIRDSLRAVMNSPGEKIGPANINDALILVKAGVEIDYTGAFADVDWDENGDISGNVPFTIFELDTFNQSWNAEQQLFVTIP